MESIFMFSLSFQEYNMIHNNCLDFGDALCNALGVGPLPRRAGVSVHSKASADLRGWVWLGLWICLYDFLEDIGA